VKENLYVCDVNNCTSTFKTTRSLSMHKITAHRHTSDTSTAVDTPTASTTTSSHSTIIADVSSVASSESTCILDNLQITEATGIGSTDITIFFYHNRWSIYL